jgi:hypothetical protein
MFGGQTLVLLSAVVVSALPVLLPVQRVSLFALSELAFAPTARLLTRVPAPMPGVPGTVPSSVLCAVLLSAACTVGSTPVLSLLTPCLVPALLSAAPAVLSGAPSAGLIPALPGGLPTVAGAGALRVLSLPVPRTLPGLAGFPLALLPLAAASLRSVPGPVRLPVAPR